jgi:hypothetical protein
MKDLKFHAGLIIALVWLFYWLNFGDGFNVSGDPAVWGQLGDYVGGILNPILSFISIIYLIYSLNLQGEANKSILDENRRQELNENKRTFELQFHNLISSQKSYFENLTIDINGSQFHADIAVTHLEDMIFQLKDDGYNKCQLAKVISDADRGDKIFSISRRFNIILSHINKNHAIINADEYTEFLISMMDYKLICLICIAEVFFDEWECTKEIISSECLNLNFLNEYKSALSN